MEYMVKSGSPEKQRVGCVIVGIFDRRKPSSQAQALDEASGGLVASVLRRGDMDGKLGQTAVLHGLDELFCDRILLVGCGKERDFNTQAYIKACETAAKALDQLGGVDAACYLTELNVRGREGFDWSVKRALLSFDNAFYEFDDCRGVNYKKQPRKLTRLTFQVPRRSDLPAAEQGAREAQAMANGITLAKNLGNLPANICTPSYLAEQAQGLDAEFDKISTKVLDEADMEKLGMGALLAVAAGSEQPAKLITMEYRGTGKSTKPYVLVGKGVTFDAGGISLKPAASMDEMKYDMGGAASVFGAIRAAAELDLPINLVGVIPSAENLLDGKSYKPGDIITTLSGQTVEVLNTDAEGRMLLCDALTYVEQNYKAEAVIDLATLTGACIVALGEHAAGLFSNNNPLLRSLRDAGDAVHDRAWAMPLWEDYQADLESNFADFAHVGGRKAGAVTAACFLHRFTRKMRWAHLDIAGVAWKSGAQKGATGRPVALLTQYLLNQLEH